MRRPGPRRRRAGYPWKVVSRPFRKPNRGHHDHDRITGPGRAAASAARSATGCCAHRWRSTSVTARTARNSRRALSECRCGSSATRSNSAAPSPASTITRGGSGCPKYCAFCDECGTRLYHAGDDERAPLSVKAGSLDDTSVLSPTCHIWTKSAQPWTAPVRENAVCCEAEPESDEALRAQWREAGRRQGAFPAGNRKLP